MPRTVLDTDTASLTHLRRLSSKLAAKLLHADPVITFVTLGELTAWPRMRSWGMHNRRELTRWLSTVPILPGDEDVATTWGKLSAAARRRGRPRPHNDMWIAACCLTHDLPLATLNVKDFEDFAEHHGLRLITP